MSEIDLITHIIETKGESYRLADAKGRTRRTKPSTVQPSPAAGSTESAHEPHEPVADATAEE